MSVEAIKQLFAGKHGGDYPMLLRYCVEPKTGTEIMKLRVKQDVFKVLVTLKGLDAIAFNDGRYHTTDLGKEALQ